MSVELVECCICYETIGDKNNCVTPCGHKFCFVCLTKALTTNNTCPCCRQVLIEAPEDDESEYESDDVSEAESDAESEDSDDENGVPPEDMIDIQEVSLEEISDSAEVMYEKMIQGGVTKTEIIRFLFSYYLGDYRSDLYESAAQIDDKIDDAFSLAFANTMRENRVKKEQMMFLGEDKCSNVNALDMIALHYA